MTCRHGQRSQPEMCSQCLGAQPKLVTLDGARILEDGKDTGRVLDPGRAITANRTQRRRRGN